MGKSGRSATNSETGWDSTLYEESFGIITEFGAGVVELLAPRPGERIVDLGCGTGGLTAQIAAAGADVLGIDSSEAMIARARELYPELRFEVARGEDFAVEEPVDAVFSSAALHWMWPPEAVAASVAKALKPGGRFVAEMGGKGNIATIIGAICQALAEEGIPRERIRNPWYFPSIGEYGSLWKAPDSRCCSCSCSTGRHRWTTVRMASPTGCACSVGPSWRPCRTSAGSASRSE